MGIDSNLAGIARVAFETTGTGEVNRDIHAVEANYRRAAAGTSESALKVQLAQDRLQKVIARGPHNYRALAAAELNLRRAESELAAQSHRTSTALQHEERTLGRLTRGALAGSGVMGHLGRSVAFASSAFLGGTGFVYALRASVKAAEEHQVVQGQLKAALGAVGISYQKYGKDIDEALAHQRSLTGFTEEQTVRSFTRLVRATGSVSSGMRALGVAQNIARGANIPLETSTLKVVRAFNGQTRGLTALGLAIPKGVKGFQALDFAQSKYARSVAEYGQTAAGAQDRLNQAIHTTEITIGTALLPTITRLSTQLADWLGKSKNQKRIQDDVNKAVKVGGEVVHDLGAAFHRADQLLGPLVRHVGGIGKVIEVAFGLAAARKLRAFAGGFNLIGTSATRNAAIVEADAKAMDAALTIATRPRNIIITTLGGGTGLGGFPGGGGTVPGRIGEYGQNPVKPTAPGIPGAGGLAGLLLSSFSIGGAGVEQGKPGTVAWDQKTNTYYFVLAGQPKRRIDIGTARKVDSKFVDKIEAFKRAQARGGTTTATTGSPLSSYHPDQPAVPAKPLDRGSRIDLQLSRTAGQSGAARVAALQAQVSFDAKYIAIQERLLRTDVAHRKQHAATLQRLYAERSGAQGEIDSINQGNAQKAQAAADKARQAQAEAASKAKQAAAERAREYRAGLATTVERLQSRVVESRTPAGRRRAEDALVRFYEHERRDRQLTDKERGRYRLLAAKERQHAHEIAVRDARSAKEATLKNAVRIAEIAAEKAGEGTAAYNKAIAAEEKALQAEANYYARLAKIDKGRKRQQDLANKLAAEKRKAALEKKTAGKTGGKTAGKDEDFAKLSADFLRQFNQLQGQYGPNIRPAGETSTPTVVVNQHFKAPTENRHREARYARFAFRAVMEG